MTTQKKNVLLILTDQQFADAMSCRMGTDYIHTPVMDELAARGTLFSKAYSPHPLCVPARASLITGRYPHELGIMDLDAFPKPGGDNAGVLIDHDRYPSIGTHFRNCGYATGYIGKWHIPLDINDPDVCGFDFAENIYIEAIRDGRVVHRHNGVDIKNAEVADRFLRTERDSPFFLTVSFNNPHNICEWARNQLRDDMPDGDVGPPPPVEQCPPVPANLGAPEDEADILLQMRAESARIRKAGLFDDNEWRIYLWAYYRMVELVDRRLGQIMETLRQTGQADNTVVLFTSDHGDACGAHTWHQKRVFYEESSRIPFIVCQPGGAGGDTSDALVQMGIDLFPTLCAAAGVPTPDGLPGLDVCSTAVAERDHIICSTTFERKIEFDPERKGVEGWMVRSARFKYCVYDLGAHRESLYDIDNDPGEMKNLARDPAYREQLQWHRDRLDRVRQNSG